MGVLDQGFPNCGSWHLMGQKINEMGHDQKEWTKIHKWEQSAEYKQH